MGISIVLGLAGAGLVVTAQFGPRCSLSLGIGSEGVPVEFGRFVTFCY
ncbi:hypothetical protein [Acrocarpospora macrocephala]|nr:hypothetical protein [Acrocarpospora macrocephala]